MAKKRTKSSAVKECDRLFSLITRSAGFCRRCGTESNLQCAHGFSRRYRAIRWDQRNAFPLCRGCHVYYTHRPLEWDEWLHRTWGRKQYDEIRTKALTGDVPDVWELLTELKNEWQSIEAR